jgi:hypothetical protein
MLFQINLGYSPISSGNFLLFLALGMMVAKFAVKSILKKLGFRTTLILNTILIGLFTASLSLLGSHYSYLATIITLLIIGFLSSLQYTCMNVITYVDLDKLILSQGTSISSLTMQLSNSFGVIVASVVLRFFMHGLDDFSLSSFNHSFILIGTFTILASSIFFFLNSDDGNKASGHKILNQ